MLEKVEPGLLLVHVQQALRAAKNLLEHLHEPWLCIDVKIFSTERLCDDFEANGRWSQTRKLYWADFLYMIFVCDFVDALNARSYYCAEIWKQCTDDIRPLRLQYALDGVAHDCQLLLDDEVNFNRWLCLLRKSPKICHQMLTQHAFQVDQVLQRALALVRQMNQQTHDKEVLLLIHSHLLQLVGIQLLQLLQQLRQQRLPSLLIQRHNLCLRQVWNQPDLRLIWYGSALHHFSNLLLQILLAHSVAVANFFIFVLKQPRMQNLKSLESVL